MLHVCAFLLSESYSGTLGYPRKYACKDTCSDALSWLCKTYR